jgi:hypothetical protein
MYWFVIRSRRWNAISDGIKTRFSILSGVISMFLRQTPHHLDTAL